MIERVAGTLLRLCETLLRWSSSLALAVVTIVGIAALLAIATWYESHYGAAAARLAVYESAFFYAVLFLLALNVAAAVISRYPWKKKQTGFIVTHVGIEILLLGCLIDIRQSAEGRVSLRPGDSVDAIDSIRDGLFVSWEGDRRTRTEVIPMDRWRDAGFPSLTRFVLSPVLGLQRIGWPQGRVVRQRVGPGIDLEILDWAPAARIVSQLEPFKDGEPGVELKISGTTPGGASIDESVFLHEPDAIGANASLFGGVVEATLWTARGDDEASQFLAARDVAAMPERGLLAACVDGAWQSIDVAAAQGQAVRIDGTPFVATIEGYFPAAKFEGGRLATDGDLPVNPMVRLKLRRADAPLGEADASIGEADAPAGEALDLVAAARFPFLTGPLAKTPDGFGPLPLFVYDHPAVLRADPASIRGRLQLLQCADGRLLYRRIGLRGIDATGAWKVGESIPAWMGLSVTLAQHQPAARRVAGFVPADVAPKDLSENRRLARVALVVDGRRETFVVGRGGLPQTLQTPRGPVTVQYGFESISLPASLTLRSARQTNDPGTTRAATYASTVEVLPIGGARSETHEITMNEPMTLGGMTFYQAGFSAETPGSRGPISTLSMRYDPGRPVKYAGCGLIVLGIFLMFYMKSYFRGPATARRPATDDTSLAAPPRGLELAIKGEA